MLPTKNTKHLVKNSFAIVLLLIWLALVGFAYLQRQNIQDWWRLRGYSAPAAVVSIANEDGLTPYARKVLYVNRPLFESRAAFTQCTQQSEKTIILGCYHSGQSGIFILQVTDSRLNGVEQVTTAHEMLHAAYERLSAKDKQSVDVMLNDYYEHDLHDQRILDTIAAYKHSEPKAVVDEMHSVFGTEVGNLPPGLEKYYKRYFSDRSIVSNFAAKYEGEFTSRLSTIKTDDAQLANLKTQIDNLKSSLTAQNADLAEQQNRLNAYKTAGNISAYNAGVPTYNNAVNRYNSIVDQTKTLIAQYNQLVEQRNNLALETQQLQQAISGQPETRVH